MRMNVRCCCQPQKIIGTLEVPREREGVFAVAMPEKLSTPSFCDVPEIADCYFEDVTVKRFGSPGCEEIAVYSDDRPIDFWRQFPSFREGEQMPDSVTNEKARRVSSVEKLYRR